MTSERTEELRRVAEAAYEATGAWPWSWCSWGEKDYGYAVVQAVSANDTPVCGEVKEEEGHVEFEGVMESHQQNGGRVCEHAATFDPPTVLALLDELERLRRERGTTILHQMDYESDGWECQECGEAWSLMNGTPSENHMRYCNGCGRRVAGEEPWRDEIEGGGAE